MWSSILPNAPEAHIDQDIPDQPTPDEGEKGDLVLLNSCEPAHLTSTSRTKNLGCSNSRFASGSAPRKTSEFSECAEDSKT